MYSDVNRSLLCCVPPEGPEGEKQTCNQIAKSYILCFANKQTPGKDFGTQFRMHHAPLAYGKTPRKKSVGTIASSSLTLTLA